MTQEKRFALLRIVFGFAWAVDAALKWAPAVRENIVSVLTQAQDGQPAFEVAWINVWVHIANINPLLFGTLIACLETALALSLIFGIFSRAALWCGLAFSLLVWSVPQGFGGPYTSGATDIDSGIIYVFVFTALIIGRAWRHYTLFQKHLA
ncbi:MAG: hypothetical protein WCI89_01240 [bacterium]